MSRGIGKRQRRETGMRTSGDMKQRNREREEQDERIRRTLKRCGKKLLVMSGKGGVGKSCVAVNIAVGLAQRGHRVGLMDVDLHGPSVPQMLGLDLTGNHAEQSEDPVQRPMGFADGKIIPAQWGENLSVVSIEPTLPDTDSPVIWRGPLKIGAIRQFIGDVAWGKLDFLVIDSPPGTGDEPLTVAQVVSDAAALIVTTPQKVARRDVRKSINFCRRLNMNLLGLVENMSGFVCPHCGETTALYSSGGGEHDAREMDVPFLGRIPLIPEVMDACDRGEPPLPACEPFAEAMGGIIDAVTRHTLQPVSGE